MADLISNTRSIVDRDPEFAKVYIPEKLKTLEVLKNKADPALYEMALEICNNWSNDK